MDEQLAQQIVNDLGKHRSRNEIIRTVCEEGGLNWPEAEKFVQQVEQEHGRAIARRQGPLLIFLSVSTLIIGVLLLLYSVEFFVAFFQGDTLEKILSVRSGYYRIAGAVTGLGMVVGGLIGMWKTVIPLLPE
ncbi:MAG: hypothetical protein ACM3MF_09530 [Anaerolineae bacterium]